MSRHSTTPAARDALAALRGQQWVPVLRSADPADAVATALACRDGGASVVELTYSTPGVLHAVAELVAAGMQVGVGTVRTPQQVSDAVEAGASFVVSFHRPVGFLEASAESGVLAIPGALTPHEVAAALDEGAHAVKVFPARLVPPAYLGDLRAVLGEVPLLVTGGIDARRSAIQPWLDAGAWCVGIGSQLGSAGKEGSAEVSRRVAALC
jgi:2-dehydro-3-deoxyphosphogluconate aldolase / (4S)-4-hydroxy-2-oxoglutarate aldolase